VSRILVVDDDRGIRGAFEALLGTRGHEVVTAETGEDALGLLADRQPDLVLMDVVLPGMDGLETFRAIKSGRPEVPVIVMTGSGTMEIAIEASKLGAFDYQLKPFDPGHMLDLIERALESARLARSHPPSHEADLPSSRGDLLVGSSSAMQELFKTIGRVAGTDATVMIRGESGSGKELVARVIHQHSRRAGRPMVTVNCAAIPETLLESELFGYERGAFTGAVARRIGMFERADGGSILLDEIGEIQIGVQSKILRVLQNKTFERVGGGETVRVDVRILGATNRDLERGMREGRFRDDLYHRLHVVTVHVPSLRERREDIPELVDAFLARFAGELGIQRPVISAEAMSLLAGYSWPGNVRELEHCLHRALIFSRGLPLQREDLLRALESRPLPSAQTAGANDDLLHKWVAGYLDTHGGQGCEPGLLDAVEREMLLQALRRSGGNQTRAAELLGIPRPTLHAKLRRHGIRTAVSVEDGRERRPTPDRGG